MVQIAILDELPERQERSTCLSQQLNLPLVKSIDDSLDFVLVYAKERLELRQLREKKSRPLAVDFLNKTSLYRRRVSSLRTELIAKAVGVKAKSKLFVLDVTAGFGVDAMLLAHFGCKILMLERSAVVAALLQDGLDRALKDELFKSSQIELLVIDANTFLERLVVEKTALPDVIYLDPMFPDRKKTALVKKEMRVLQQLVGKDYDADVLFHKALQCAKKRVVVKRPKHAPFLAERKPDILFRGNVCRYDVYFP